MTRQELTSRMHRAGLRLDDAALAADVAINVMRRQRDAVIVAAIRCGLSVRQTARLLGLSKSQVARVSHDCATGGTPSEEKMQAPEKFGGALPCPQSSESERGSS